MALPNGNLLEVIKEEEKRAALAVKSIVSQEHIDALEFPFTKEVSVSEIIGKIDGLEIRLSRTTQRTV